MAGYYILKNISTSELSIAQNKLQAGWSSLQHANVGWTDISRQILNDALQGNNITNRNNLPPHRYLQINAENPLSPDKIQYLRRANWVDRLVRPISQGLGLRNITPQALEEFQRGNYAASLIAQIQHGTVSIEIYYTNNLEMA
ncbi:hypothetical protein BJP36_19735 [Moorena producens JHB]|uniref:Uncharacterized protein n=1 Tax=Moorena producens (strain JHB) TaxID=1454205 RepID=A0A1D9G2M8_MOOP1|nr:hypothetical protein [Moorena producens]AOY81811.1 hypothetical protein BJP36_19735 [Moorena producens JHB]